MSGPHGFHPSAELRQLVERYCDGELTTAERDALERELLGNRPAQQFLLAYMQAHAQLQWNHRGLARQSDAVAPPAVLPLSLG